MRWMDGMSLPGLSPFSGMEMWLDPAPFALCSPHCVQCCAAAALEQMNRARNRDLNHCH